VLIQLVVIVHLLKNGFGLQVWQGQVSDVVGGPGGVHLWQVLSQYD
jgi:hypothetical protein